MTDKIDSQELYRSEQEDEIRSDFVRHFRKCPIPDGDILQNLGLFLNSKNLSRILFMHYIYQQIIDVPGVVMEFGTRWGQNVSLFSALRGIYEPFNRMRKIIGFDTFTGFPTLDRNDNLQCSIIRKGGLACTDSYAEYLSGIMRYQEQDNPLAHIRKFEIRVGDACVEVPRYLEQYPETIVAMAFFDFDVYEPTRKCLQAIKPHLVRGSLLGFDELNDHDSPGETIALSEVIGLNNIKLKRYPYTARTSYFIYE